MLIHKPKRCLSLCGQSHSEVWLNYYHGPPLGYKLSSCHIRLHAIDETLCFQILIAFRTVLLPLHSFKQRPGRSCMGPWSGRRSQLRSQIAIYQLSDAPAFIRDRELRRIFWPQRRFMTQFARVKWRGSASGREISEKTQIVYFQRKLNNKERVNTEARRCVACCSVTPNRSSARGAENNSSCVAN